MSLKTSSSVSIDTLEDQSPYKRHRSTAASPSSDPHPSSSNSDTSDNHLHTASVTPTTVDPLSSVPVPVPVVLPLASAPVDSAPSTHSELTRSDSKRSSSQPVTDSTPAPSPSPSVPSLTVLHSLPAAVSSINNMSDPIVPGGPDASAPGGPQPSATPTPTTATTTATATAATSGEAKGDEKWTCAKCTVQQPTAPLAICPVCDAPVPRGIKWACQKCTFENAPTDASCQVCGHNPIAVAPVAPAIPAGHWACTACTFLNPNSAQQCGVCDTRNPARAAPAPAPVIPPAVVRRQPAPVVPPPARVVIPPPVPQRMTQFGRPGGTIAPQAPNYSSVANRTWEKSTDEEPEDDDGNTPLLRACKENDGKRALELIAQGVDINARNHDGRTALMYASEKRNVEVVRALLLSWVDIRPIDRMGNTAKDLATGGAIYQMLKHRESQKTLADNAANRRLAFLMASHPLAYSTEPFPGNIAEPGSSPAPASLLPPPPPPSPATQGAAIGHIMRLEPHHTSEQRANICSNIFQFLPKF